MAVFCGGSFTEGGITSASVDSFLFFPNLGIRLNRLARRFFVVGESWFAGLLLISCSGVVGSSPAGADSDPILGSAVRVGEEDSWSAPGLVVRSSSVEMVEEHSDPTVITDSGRSKKKRVITV